MLNVLRNLVPGSRPRVDAMPVLLIAGPESSGTRIFTDIFSRHPLALGADAALEHQDLLDDVWRLLARKRRRAAVTVLSALPRDRVIVTRRSVPHGAMPGVAARYGEFPDLHGFVAACRSAGRSVIVLVTSRSPAACIASSVAQRASVGRDPERARRQYAAANAAIFDVVVRRRLPFLVLSVEALVLDGDEYVQCLFRMLGIGAAPVQLPVLRNPNPARYVEFQAFPGVMP